ncbi:hypothetical protein DEA8626_02918 [Defluviimonas aquaemixtae]|uniref:LPS-assembly lipoprotein LptE n=1 Tax=Albidovulum aquaemixtae TaxID=1542388 RepID=A0A2R8BKD0_9RHOB|nr:LPS assembly lipoprotein LptE [Defluviimonas aquaemixtae]SPH23846.1 hypothetical protein DEA8626_02918 [Defluviimonas aquaemixtae]
MSSSDRRTFLAGLLALLLAGCGFEPAYAPGGPASGLLDQVRVDDPADKDDFDLVERLEERLGRPGSPRFRLSYDVNTKVESQAITPESVITRYQLLGNVSYRLHDIATDSVLSAGEVASFTSYSAVGTSVATAAGEADARTRLMRLLADRMLTELIATSAEWNRR